MQAAGVAATLLWPPSAPTGHVHRAQ